MPVPLGFVVKKGSNAWAITSGSIPTPSSRTERRTYGPGGSDSGRPFRRAAASIPGVQEVEKCIVRKTGHRYFVDMHVEVDPAMSVQQGHGIAHDVKDKVREQIPAVRDVLVHIEPSGQRRRSG